MQSSYTMKFAKDGGGTLFTPDGVEIVEVIFKRSVTLFRKGKLDSFFIEALYPKATKARLKLFVDGKLKLEMPLNTRASFLHSSLYLYDIRVTDRLRFTSGTLQPMRLRMGYCQ